MSRLLTTLAIQMPPSASNSKPSGKVPGPNSATVARAPRLPSLRIAPDGSQSVVLEDSAPAQVAAVERKYQDGVTLARADIDAGRAGVLGNLASVAFGGRDLRTIFLGSLFAPRIATFRSAVVGARPPHWDY
jgi:hypothetical protein